MPNDFFDSRHETGNPPTGDQPLGPAPRHHRTVLFYGDEAFARIRQARVMVIGLGGVGGHAAVNLARSGVGALHLVDFDVVTESSLNRSPYAEPADVGRPKTAVLAQYLNRVCPDTHVIVTEAFCDDALLPDLLPPASIPAAQEAQPTSGSPGGTDGPPPVDLVLDAIDSLQAKVSLLAWCHEHGIPVIASMGAAGKRDVGAVRTGDLSATQVCPLARQVRNRLKRRGITSGIPCVWSVEKGDAARPEAPPEAGTNGASETSDHSRPTLASQMTIPGVFGYGLAAMALDHLTAHANAPTQE